MLTTMKCVIVCTKCKRHHFAKMVSYISKRGRKIKAYNEDTTVEYSGIVLSVDECIMCSKIKE